MRKADVQLGAVYSAQISGKVVPVRIDLTNPYGGWNATNLRTNRAVRIKSAAKLRKELHRCGMFPGWHTIDPAKHQREED